MQNHNAKSPHILNAASNHIGFCFLVLTSIRFLKMQEETYVDDITAVAFLLFMASSLISFLSMRSKKTATSITLENIAEYAFLGGLLCVFVAALFITSVIFH